MQIESNTPHHLPGFHVEIPIRDGGVGTHHAKSPEKRAMELELNRSQPMTPAGAERAWGPFRQWDTRFRPGSSERAAR